MYRSSLISKIAALGRNRDADVENRRVEKVGEGGMNGEVGIDI